MIVWQGLGFIGFLIPVVFYFLTQVIFDAAFGKGYTEAHHWVWGVSLLLSGIIVAALGWQMSRGGGRELVDPNTGQRIILKRRHTLFWIPLEYVGVILCVVGIARFFV